MSPTDFGSSATDFPPSPTDSAVSATSFRLRVCRSVTSTPDPNSSAVESRASAIDFLVSSTDSNASRPHFECSPTSSTPYARDFPVLAREPDRTAMAAARFAARTTTCVVDSRSRAPESVPRMPATTERASASRNARARHRRRSTPIGRCAHQHDRVRETRRGELPWEMATRSRRRRTTENSSRSRVQSHCQSNEAGKIEAAPRSTDLRQPLLRQGAHSCARAACGR